MAHCPQLSDEEFRQRLYNHSYFCQRCDFNTTNKVCTRTVSYSIPRLLLTWIISRYLQDELDGHQAQHRQVPNPLITKWRGRYHCDRCSFSATNSVTLSHHQKTHQKQPNLAPERNGKSGEGIAFACAECMTRFGDRQDVLRHQQQVHGRLPIQWILAVLYFRMLSLQNSGYIEINLLRIISIMSSLLLSDYAEFGRMQKVLLFRLFLPTMDLFKFQHISSSQTIHTQFANY